MNAQTLQSMPGEPLITLARMCRPGRKGLVCGMRLLALLLTFFMAGSAPAIYAENESITEYHIKAAFLYNFAKFVEWPATAFANDAAPFNLCVIGIEPFISVRETLMGKTIKGRSVEVRRVDSATTAGQCQMLFVSAADSTAVEAVPAEVLGHALTVGETNDFISRGGIINLKTVENKVRFEIDRASGEQFGFKFSSQLLKLAILVDRQH
ncbi:YfiR family protein [Sedimenticola hydrogenitrophicus]|uniref:YfiR family protein n=1 Tax=Sedimenticola hydrogenitrophicus TaxID=2967975 RepID=UPI0023B0E5B9|nr:YfiR family protein [Sedimenticola hydrogenitrophicus]